MDDLTQEPGEFRTDAIQEAYETLNEERGERVFKFFKGVSSARNFWMMTGGMSKNDKKKIEAAFEQMDKALDIFDKTSGLGL
jgi:hypothetical protein